MVLPVMVSKLVLISPPTLATSGTPIVKLTLVPSATLVELLQVEVVVS